MGDQQQSPPSSWCVVDIDGNRINACVEHTGRGRFVIEDDDGGGEYIGLVVDTSDIISCNIDKPRQCSSSIIAG